MDKLFNEFIPNFDNISKLVCSENTFANELEVVRRSESYENLFSDMLKPTEQQFDAVGIDDVDFDSIIPKEVQDETELYGYMDYLNSK